MKIGITGHQKLENSRGWEWVDIELTNIITQLPKPLTGITSLAIGADQLFAKIILQNGGCLNVILPFEGYEFVFDDDGRRNYYQLLERAANVETLSKMTSNEESYFEAGKQIVDKADLLIAVWDSKPAKGLGGTADVVRYAKQCGKKIIHINPISRTVADIKFNQTP
jgi:hypothetical protein